LSTYCKPGTKFPIYREIKSNTIYNTSDQRTWPRFIESTTVSFCWGYQLYSTSADLLHLIIVAQDTRHAGVKDYIPASVPAYPDPQNVILPTLLYQPPQHHAPFSLSYTCRRISGNLLLDRLNNPVQFSPRLHGTQHCPSLHKRY
jgi:hypothetical protein